MQRTRLVKQREYDLEEDNNDQCDSFEIGISSASTASDSSSVEVIRFLPIKSLYSCFSTRLTVEDYYRKHMS